MSQSNPTLAACLVIRNEATVLERCFASLPAWIDRIYVVHDGKCTDSSLEICRKFNAIVSVRPYVGIAEPHRAWLYSTVQEDWILQLDADEFLTDLLVQKLPQLLQKSEVAVFEFFWPYWNGKRYLTKDWPTKRALFQRSKISFLAFPQEEVLPTTGTVQRVPYQLHHQPQYDNFSFKVFRKKWLRWAALHAQSFLAYQKDPQIFPTYPKGRHITPHYLFLCRWKILAAPGVFLYHSIVSFLLGARKHGLLGMKMSVFLGMYYAAVAYYCSFPWEKQD